MLTLNAKPTNSSPGRETPASGLVRHVWIFDLNAPAPDLTLPTGEFTDGFSGDSLIYYAKPETVFDGNVGIQSKEGGGYEASIEASLYGLNSELLSYLENVNNFFGVIVQTDKARYAFRNQEGKDYRVMIEGEIQGDNNSSTRLTLTIDKPFSTFTAVNTCDFIGSVPAGALVFYASPNYEGDENYPAGAVSTTEWTDLSGNNNDIDFTSGTGNAGLSIDSGGYLVSQAFVAAGFDLPFSLNIPASPGNGYTVAFRAKLTNDFVSNNIGSFALYGDLAAGGNVLLAVLTKVPSETTINVFSNISDSANTMTSVQRFRADTDADDAAFCAKTEWTGTAWEVTVFYVVFAGEKQLASGIISFEVSNLTGSLQLTAGPYVAVDFAVPEGRGVVLNTGVLSRDTTLKGYALWDTPLSDSDIETAAIAFANRL